MRHFSCTVSKLQVLARNFDCFIMLFVPRVTGLINHFDLVFSFFDSLLETAIYYWSDYTHKNREEQRQKLERKILEISCHVVSLHPQCIHYCFEKCPDLSLFNSKRKLIIASVKLKWKQAQKFHSTFLIINLWLEFIFEVGQDKFCSLMCVMLLIKKALHNVFWLIICSIVLSRKLCMRELIYLPLHLTYLLLYLSCFQSTGEFGVSHYFKWANLVSNLFRYKTSLWKD